MNNKEALVFGATGQDGSYLAEFLLAKGYRFVTVSQLINMETAATTAATPGPAPGPAAPAPGAGGS